jgi:SOUL heme-binding protein
MALETAVARQARGAGSTLAAGKDRAGHAEKAGGKPRVIGDVEIDEPGHGADIRSISKAGKLSRLKGGGAMRMRTLVLAFTLGVAMGTAAVAEATHKGYEMPPYTVELTDGAREVRDYGPHLLAEVKVSGSRNTAIQTGFRLLAGYIFGGNAAGEKIAMTVPVAQTPDGDDWTVSFMMPARFTKDSLPAPKSDAIRFVKVPAARQVVQRFSGIPTTAKLDALAAALKSWAEAEGLTILAGPHFYFYDAPMTLPWNRRNEVAFTIR